jgi:hypothetical protein
MMLPLAKVAQRETVAANPRGDGERRCIFSFDAHDRASIDFPAKINNKDLTLTFC